MFTQIAGLEGVVGFLAFLDPGLKTDIFWSVIDNVIKNMMKENVVSGTEVETVISSIRKRCYRCIKKGVLLNIHKVSIIM